MDLPLPLQYGHLSRRYGFSTIPETTVSSKMASRLFFHCALGFCFRGKENQGCGLLTAPPLRSSWRLLLLGGRFLRLISFCWWWGCEWCCSITDMRMHNASGWDISAKSQRYMQRMGRMHSRRASFSRLTFVMPGMLRHHHKCRFWHVSCAVDGCIQCSIGVKVHRSRLSASYGITVVSQHGTIIRSFS